MSPPGLGGRRTTQARGYQCEQVGSKPASGQSKRLRRCSTAECEAMPNRKALLVAIGLIATTVAAIFIAMRTAGIGVFAAARPTSRPR